MNPRLPALLLASLILLLGSPSGSASPQPGAARLAALIRDARLNELSGLTASRRHEGMFWVHNDSDGPAELFAINAHGEVLATVLLQGASNRDWEDIAAFEHDGLPYIVVADTGDNGGLRRELELAVVAEPELRDSSVKLAWKVRFRWPDGPRDTEALAVDPQDGHAYLISKKRVPPELWRVPLRVTQSNELVVAERLGTVAGIDQPSPEDLARNPVFGRYRSQITAFDISADGHLAAVLNYRSAFLYRRAEGEGWTEALAREPVAMPFPWLAQAEALGFARDGRRVWITTERLPAPLLEIPLQR